MGERRLRVLHWSEEIRASGTDLLVDVVDRLRAEGCPIDLDIRTGARPAMSALWQSDVVVQPARIWSDGLDWLRTVRHAGRPLIASAFGGSQPLLGRQGMSHSLAGTWCSIRQHFEPDRRCLRHELLVVLQRPDQALADAGLDRSGGMTESDSITRLAGRSGRPLVVLEAPLFELSSATILTLATGVALHQRGFVDLCLVADQPSADVARVLSDQAPELLPCLRHPDQPADLWLSAGWPPRSHRPPCRRYLLRVDWEYGAIPAAMANALQWADGAVVHSRTVALALRAAGLPAARIHRIPHGVDARHFRPHGQALRSVLDFKGDRMALLFAGGLIWRKGIDLLLAAMVQMQIRDPSLPARMCLVVKSMGEQTSYRGYHLRELVQRFADDPRLPDVLFLDDALAPSAMAGLYRACDLLVHPYRGEGFGMPILEARACGLPVVVTAGGSSDDFCVAPTGTPRPGCSLVPAVRRLVDLPGVHVGRPFVLEPELDRLQECLQTAIGRRDELRAEAQAGVGDGLDDFSWEQAAAAIEEQAFLSRIPTVPLAGLLAC